MTISLSSVEGICISGCHAPCPCIYLHIQGQWQQSRTLCILFYDFAISIFCSFDFEGCKGGFQTSSARLPNQVFRRTSADANIYIPPSIQPHTCKTSNRRTTIFETSQKSLENTRNTYWFIYGFKKTGKRRGRLRRKKKWSGVSGGFRTHSLEGAHAKS